MESEFALRFPGFWGPGGKIKEKLLKLIFLDPKLLFFCFWLFSYFSLLGPISPYHHFFGGIRGLGASQPAITPASQFDCPFSRVSPQLVPTWAVS